MDIDPIAVVGALALTALTLLLTGPGLWSERWGWRRWLRHTDRGTPREDERPR